MNGGEAAEQRSVQAWLRLAVPVLAVAAVGLPVHALWSYGLLVAAALVAFTGDISTSARRWLAAAGGLAAVLALQWLVAPPRFDEGHNLFLPGPKLEQGLPSGAYRSMAADFAAQYPPDKHCDPKAGGCWRQSVPRDVYGFSADGIFHRSELSRAVTALDFSAPVRLRPGFVNEIDYNWYGVTDVERARRDRRFWMGFQRWHLTMPWFEALRFPAAYEGSRLCWRGDVLWPDAAGEYRRVTSADEQCRAIEKQDAGRIIFGVAIKPESLSMRLDPPLGMRLRGLAVMALSVAGVAGVLALLVSWRPRCAALAAAFIAIGLLFIAVDDASFIGGLRPMEGGDDGLFYDGVGRNILRYLLAGDWMRALEGGEAVYYYGGPGLRYFRALEHIVFGETYLGYLSLVLALPFAVWAVFRRFLNANWALGAAIVFLAIPVGGLFGTSFINYATWAGRGFADPAAYILFICGIVPIVGASAAGPSPRFFPALCGGLLMALAIFMKPIVAPACAALLSAAGLAALYRRHWLRLAGLCIGFAPVFLITLHNWVFGHVLVLFSSNAGHAYVLTMPPSAYLAALRELAALDFAGEEIRRGLWQIAGWLRGPSESYALIPVSLAGVVVVFRVVSSRRYEGWLRAVAITALAQHAVALFYVATARYHYLTWFLTLVAVLAWLETEGVPWAKGRFPEVFRRAAASPAVQRLACGLATLRQMHS